MTRSVRFLPEALVASKPVTGLPGESLVWVRPSPKPLPERSASFPRVYGEVRRLVVWPFAWGAPAAARRPPITAPLRQAVGCSAEGQEPG